MRIPSLTPSLLSCCAVLVGVLPAQEEREDERYKELLERIEELEAITADLEHKQSSTGPVHTFSAERISLGGHLTSVFTHIRAEDGNETGHAVTLAELFLTAEITDRLSVFVTPGFTHLTPPAYINNRHPNLNASDSLSDVLLARAYGEFRYHPLLNVQAGIIGTPHGITNREYFIPSRRLTSSNLHTRIFLDNMLYAQHLVGVKLSGQRLLGEHGTRSLGYDLYLGSEHADPNGSEWGLHVSHRWNDLGLSLAANYGHGGRESFSDLNGGLPTAFNVPILSSPFPGVSNVRNSYDFAGLDLDWRGERASLRLEAYRSWEEGQEDRKAFSVMPGFQLRDDTGLSYRFDYFAAGQGLGIATEHSLGIYYDYRPQARLRLDLAHQELPNSADAVDYLVLSFSLSF